MSNMADKLNKQILLSIAKYQKQFHQTKRIAQYLFSL